jgi:hypothetical protein
MLGEWAAMTATQNAALNVAAFVRPLNIRTLPSDRDSPKR